MSYEEAIWRIEDHMRIHYMQEGWRCEGITEALQLAIKALEEKANNDIACKCPTCGGKGYISEQEDMALGD